MRRPRIILIASILALAGAADLLGHWVQPKSPFDVRFACVRDNATSTQSLRVELRTANPFRLVWSEGETFQVRICGQWLTPSELWWEDHGTYGPFVACPAIDRRVEACRLSVAYERESPSAQFQIFCVKEGVASFGVSNV